MSKEIQEYFEANRIRLDATFCLPLCTASGYLGDILGAELSAMGRGELEELLGPVPDLVWVQLQSSRSEPLCSYIRDNRGWLVKVSRMHRKYRDDGTFTASGTVWYSKWFYGAMLCEAWDKVVEWSEACATAETKLAEDRP